MAWSQWKTKGQYWDWYQSSELKDKQWSGTDNNQIPYPALKTKREITKYIIWQKFTKDTGGKPNEKWSFSYLN